MMKAIREFGWSFYLACSWVWCIGMFLPVLLDKYFGPGLWLFFILCNVLGVIAFPFFIRSARVSHFFLKKHLQVCCFFSVITMAFQVFFIGWIFSRMPLLDSLPFLFFLAFFFWRRASISQLKMASVFVWVVSSVLFFVYALALPQIVLANQLVHEVLVWNPSALYLLPLFMFGFLLSPYLDLTFHHVVQEEVTMSSHRMKTIFIVAFLILFLGLMLFTLMYVGDMNTYFFGPYSHVLSVCEKLVLVYFMLQLVFTLSLHRDRLEAVQPSFSGFKLYAYLFVFLIAPTLLSHIIWVGMSANEIIYRCFILFYGIVAPAYVWCVILNKNHGYMDSGRLTARAWFAIAVIFFALALLSVPVVFQGPYVNTAYPVAVALVVLLRYLPVQRKR